MVERGSIVGNIGRVAAGSDPSVRQTGPHSDSYVAVGVLCGFVCLGAFLVIHAIWIAPIWNVAVIGVILACAGGVVAARCYALARHLMPARPVSWIMVFGMLVAPLVPCVILTSALPPLLEAENGEIVHPINVPWLVTGFFVNLLIPATAVGAAIGWVITNRRSAVALFATMGLLMALGPGHNLPLFGVFGDATGAQLLKAFVLTFAPMGLGAVVLVEMSTLRRSRAEDEIRIYSK